MTARGVPPAAADDAADTVSGLPVGEDLTLAQALAAATARLDAAAIADPARDARRLLAHAAGLDAGRLTLHLPDPLTPEAARRFECALAARLGHRPVAQITGRRAFWGRDFRVTSDVLDPRPETETLIAAALAITGRRVLDIGTGSGCILLTLLAEWPGATGIGTDASGPALEVARANAAALGVSDRAAFRRTDWAAGVAGPFDLIVSNPPYIEAAAIARLAPEVRDWEPRAALTPGPGGLEAYRAFLPQAARLLGPGGRVLVEIGPTQAESVAGIGRAAGLRLDAILPDLDGRDRIVAFFANSAA